MAEVRLGLIGAGRWGRNYIRTVEGLPGAVLRRVASCNPATKELVPDDCHIDFDWREVVQAKDLDGVVIATPPALHIEMASVAVEAGLPVLVEKPLSLDIGEAEALGRLVAKHAGYVMVEHTQLYNPAFVALKRTAFLLGEVRSIYAEAGSWGPFREDANVLWDWGAHDVAMCLDLIREFPSKVSARRLRQNTKGGETIELTMIFSNDVAATVNISNMREDKVRRFAFRCRDGALLFDDLAADKLVLNSSVAVLDTITDAMEYSGEMPLARAVQKFVEDIRAGKQDGGSLRLGIDVVRILSQFQRSLERGDG